MTTGAAAADDWGFERVTPGNKGGGVVSSVDTFQSRADGEGFLYSAIGPFDQVPAESSPLYTRYLGLRGADAWRSTAMDPPYATGVGSGVALFDVMGVVGSSADLSHVLVSSRRVLAPGAIEGGGSLYMKNATTGVYTLVASSPDPNFEFNGVQGATNVNYVAPDGRSALFTSRIPLVPGAENFSLYSWTAEGGLRTESILPASEGGSPVSTVAVAGGDEVGPRDPMPLGEGGLDHVYFESLDGGSFGPLYVRSNGVTKPVSYSRVAGPGTPAVPAMPRAVGAGGRFMLFATRGDTPLTSDTPGGVPGPFLYRYDAEDESLEYVGAADASRIVQMTQDGQTIAFGSTVAQAGAPGDPGEQMYVWENGTLRFVAGGLTTTTGNLTLRRLSRNGRFLSFTDDSASLAASFGVANNISAGCPFFGMPGLCAQVYVYDVDADELHCASCRPGPDAPAGGSGDPTNSAPGSIRLNGYQAQTVSNDGTTFFTSRDALLPEDGNGAPDVYAYKEGHLRLLSRATQGTSARFLDATPDGRAVFFSTNDAITEDDTDREVDVYVTREGAGFAFSRPVPPGPCSGGDCRGVVERDTDSVGSPSTSTVGAGGNPKAESTGPLGVRVARVERKGSTLRLTVRVTAGGAIRASGATFRPVTRTVARSGTYILKTRLTAATVKKLKKRRVVTRVRVSLSPPFGRAVITNYRRTLGK